MCLIGLAWRQHPRFPLIVAANRDEFHARASDPLAWWPGDTCLAGRDRVGGGTWLGVTRDGRFAALTNYREPVAPDASGARPSRGDLVMACLRDAHATLPDAYHAMRAEFAGFNLLSGRIFGRAAALHFVSNRDADRSDLAPGVFGLSNGDFDAPWPKARALKGALAQVADNAAATPAQIADALLLALESRQQTACAEALPDTGLGVDLERRLSASFILGEHYGTRCSTLLIVDRDGYGWMTEHTFAPSGERRFARRYVWRITSDGAP